MIQLTTLHKQLRTSGDASLVGYRQKKGKEGIKTETMKESYNMYINKQEKQEKRTRDQEERLRGMTENKRHIFRIRRFNMRGKKEWTE